MSSPSLTRLTRVFRDFYSAIAGRKSFSALHLTTLADTPTYEHGLVFYKDGVLNVMAEFQDVIMQVGEELQYPVVNKQGSTILNGQPVYISGAQGNRLAVKLAESTDLNTTEVLGLATHDILNNQNGRVTFIGAVRDLDTQAFTVGLPVYVDGLGTLTQTKPLAASSYAAEIGYVTVSHPTQGVIYCHAPRLQRFIAGPTAQRPAVNVRVGNTWFDTTLGKPIWWTGSAWVDATGASV